MSNSPDIPSSPGFFELMLAAQQLEMIPERIEVARSVHEGMRPVVKRLRAVPFSYVEPVIEPTSAQAWIDDGGHTP